MKIKFGTKHNIESIRDNFPSATIKRDPYDTFIVEIEFKEGQLHRTRGNDYYLNGVFLSNIYCEAYYYYDNNGKPKIGTRVKVTR